MTEQERYDKLLAAVAKLRSRASATLLTPNADAFLEALHAWLLDHPPTGAVLWRVYVDRQDGTAAFARDVSEDCVEFYIVTPRTPGYVTGRAEFERDFELVPGLKGNVE